MTRWKRLNTFEISKFPFPHNLVSWGTSYCLLIYMVVSFMVADRGGKRKIQIFEFKNVDLVISSLLIASFTIYINDNNIQQDIYC